MDCEEWSSLISTRYLLLGVVGAAIALFGLLANVLLSALFLTRSHYRHSPFFFLGFVALFDTFLDATFLVLLSLPVTAEFFKNERMFIVWVYSMQSLHLLWNIFKLASVFCLIMASIERYCMTRHWTFTGFSRRTRWLVLALLVSAAVLIKNVTLDVWVEERPQCAGFSRYRMGALGQYNLGLINTVAIFVPFATLVFLNGGIVLMLRKQNVQQLRSLITELTMGHDVMKIRRRNLRSATNTLLLIISVYLISNSLNLLLAMADFFHADYLQLSHPDVYRLATDTACLLTVIGNAIRCPAHFLSNSEIRQQFWMLFQIGEVRPKVALTGASLAPDLSVRRCSDRLENPWISILLTVHDRDQPDSPLLRRNYAKRHSSIAIC